MVLLGLDLGELGEAALDGGGELGVLGLGAVEVGGEGGEALLEEGAGLLGGDGGGVGLRARGFDLAPELADRGVRALRHRGGVVGEELELLVR